MNGEEGDINTVVGSGFLPSAVGRIGAVNWAAIRDKHVPTGLPIETKAAIGRPFTILRMRPYLSQFKGTRETVYFVVALFEDGELANFTVGGVAACDQLDAIYRMNNEFKEAVRAGNINEAQRLRDMGAGVPLKVTLLWNEGGQGEGYYTLE